MGIGDPSLHDWVEFGAWLVCAKPRGSYIRPKTSPHTWAILPYVKGYLTIPGVEEGLGPGCSEAPLLRPPLFLLPKMPIQKN